MGRNVLFYSKHCKHSIKFIDSLKKIPALFNTFVFISIDIRSNTIPSYITRVPSVIVYDKSNRKHVMTDRNAFEWLNINLETIEEKIELQPFDTMSSTISDNYASLDESGPSFNNNFIQIDRLDKEFIYTIPEDNTNKNEKPDANRMLEQFQNERDAGIPQQRIPVNQPAPNFTQNIAREPKILDTDYQRFENMRNGDIKRRPPPKHAPQFQSSNFRSQLFQSGPYQPSGEDIIPQQAVPQMRQRYNPNQYRIQKPSAVPNFESHWG